MTAAGIYRRVVEFLFSNVNKEFVTFLFFIVLSAVFWLMTTLNQTYEQEILVPVKVSDIPRNIMLTSDETDTAHITIRDKGWQLLGYMYGKRLKAVLMPFKNYDNDNGNGSIPAADIKKAVEQMLESSSKVTAVKPERMEFFFNSGERKSVPVRWRGRVTPEQLYFIAATEYSQDSVDVYAPKEKLDSISVVYTEQLNYADFRDTLTVSCRLAHDRDVKVVPERISIRFLTDVLTEEVIEGVPIKTVNMPGGMVLRTFPARVSIHIVAGASQVRNTRPEDFEVVADYNDIANSHAEKCNIRLRQFPQGISRATLSVSQVDYLIEED